MMMEKALWIAVVMITLGILAALAGHRLEEWLAEQSGRTRFLTALALCLGSGALGIYAVLTPV